MTVPAPMFLMSATLLFSGSSYTSQSGIRHTRSPVAAKAASTARSNGSSVPSSAGAWWPNATITAPGEGGGVDHRRRLQRRRVAEGVGHHQAALGVGVEHLDGDAAVGPHHVAGTLRTRAGHVLRGRDQPYGTLAVAQAADRLHAAEHGGGAM